MGVVGGCHGDACFPRKLDELRQNDVVLFQSVILQLNVIVALAEQVAVPQRAGFGTLIVACQNGLRDLTGQTGRQADQSLVILFQQLLIDAGLGVKALHKRGRYHFDKVFVTGLIFAQQDQMVIAIDLVHLIKAGAGGNIDFAADNRLDARLFSRLVKLHAAVHNAMVCAGNGGLPALFYALHQLVDAAGTVQKAVFRMDVQMNEVPSKTIVLTDLAHAVPPVPDSSADFRPTPPVSSSGVTGRICSPQAQSSRTVP